MHSRPRRQSRVTVGGTAMTLIAAALTACPSPALAAATTGPSLTVDVAAARHAISPDIYGLNGAGAAFAAEIGLPVARWGGNASTRYNFKNHTRDRGTKQIVTVPLIGWVAQDSPSSHPFLCGSPATRFPAQDSFDQWDPNCGNGRLNDANLTGADPSDTSIPAGPSFASKMVTHLVGQFGRAARGGVRIYELDKLDLATMWGEPQPAQPGAYAFRMYRNYDGAGSRFGDIGVSAASGDQGRLAVYAVQRASDKALTLMVVNKTGEDLAVAGLRHELVAAVGRSAPGRPARRPSASSSVPIAAASP